MRPVGYLFNTGEGLAGQSGLFYNYILAGNGVFIRACNPLLGATLCIARAQVRGLSPLGEKLELPKGKIPRGIYDLALSILAVDPWRERYLAVTWDGEYHLQKPLQEGGAAGVVYERLPGTVVDIHSHSGMSAFFSGTDNRDEQGLRLYMVVGELERLWPDVELRVGVYGYFAPLEMGEAFDVHTG